jgi:hypothetical protein
MMEHPKNRCESVRRSHEGTDRTGLRQAARDQSGGGLPLDLGACCGAPR